MLNYVLEVLPIVQQDPPFRVNSISVLADIRADCEAVAQVPYAPVLWQRHTCSRYWVAAEQQVVAIDERKRY